MITAEQARRNITSLHDEYDVDDIHMINWLASIDAGIEKKIRLKENAVLLLKSGQMPMRLHARLTLSNIIKVLVLLWNRNILLRVIVFIVTFIV